MKCFWPLYVFLPSLPFFWTVPPPSCSQAQEVDLSRHLICLVLSLVLWTRSGQQIHDHPVLIKCLPLHKMARPFGLHKKETWQNTVETTVTDGSRCSFSALKSQSTQQAECLPWEQRDEGLTRACDGQKILIYGAWVLGCVSSPTSSLLEFFISYRQNRSLNHHLIFHFKLLDFSPMASAF